MNMKTQPNMKGQHNPFQQLAFNPKFFPNNQHRLLEDIYNVIETQNGPLHKQALDKLTTVFRTTDARSKLSNPQIVKGLILRCCQDMAHTTNNSEDKKIFKRLNKDYSLDPIATAEANNLYNEHCNQLNHGERKQLLKKLLHFKDLQESLHTATSMPHGAEAMQMTLEKYVHSKENVTGDKGRNISLHAAFAFLTKSAPIYGDGKITLSSALGDSISNLYQRDVEKINTLHASLVSGMANYYLAGAADEKKAKKLLKTFGQLTRQIRTTKDQLRKNGHLNDELFIKENTQFINYIRAFSGASTFHNNQKYYNPKGAYLVTSSTGPNNQTQQFDVTADELALLHMLSNIKKKDASKLSKAMNMIKSAPKRALKTVGDSYVSCALAAALFPGVNIAAGAFFMAIMLFRAVKNYYENRGKIDLSASEIQEALRNYRKNKAKDQAFERNEEDTVTLEKGPKNKNGNNDNKDDENTNVSLSKQSGENNTQSAAQPVLRVQSSPNSSPQPQHSSQNDSTRACNPTHPRLVVGAAARTKKRHSNADHDSNAQQHTTNQGLIT